MPRIEYGVDEERVAELRSELELLKVNLHNASASNATKSVEMYESRINEITALLEGLNVLDN